MEKGKKDLLLIVAVLIIAAAGFLINNRIHKKPAAYVEISVDTRTVATYDLNKDMDLVLETYNGGTNHLIIQNGQVWISEASCPDKVCIHQGHISMNGELIVCLPNRMIAKVVAPEDV